MSRDLEPAAPTPGVSYPLKVTYCGVCSMPLEYCEYGGTFEQCKKWLAEALPDMFAQMYAAPDGDAKQATDGDGKPAGDGAETGAAAAAAPKKQKRGGKGSKPVAVAAAADGNMLGPNAKVTLKREARAKHKTLTIVRGLKSCGVDPKEASKYFSRKFACSSSVTAGGVDELLIGGDVVDELFDVIPDKWKQITDDRIEEE